MDPLNIRWTRGVGYDVVEDAEDAEPSSRRTPAAPIDDRVLLHLLELGPDTRPSARRLAAALRCQGRRYDELSAALERLLADGSVDHAERPGATSSRDSGYALTPRGHLRAESLREASTVSTNREEAEAKGATVSEPASHGVAGNGNATATATAPPAEEQEGQPGDAATGDVDGPKGLC